MYITNDCAVEWYRYLAVFHSFEAGIAKNNFQLRMTINITIYEKIDPSRIDLFYNESFFSNFSGI